MISPEAVRQLRSTIAWPYLEKHLRDNVLSLDTTAGIEGDDRAMAIEVLARRRAAEKLLAILEPFELFQEQADTGALVRAKEEEAGLEVYPHDERE